MPHANAHCKGKELLDAGRTKEAYDWLQLTLKSELETPENLRTDSQWQSLLMLYNLIAVALDDLCNLTDRHNVITNAELALLCFTRIMTKSESDYQCAREAANLISAANEINQLIYDVMFNPEIIRSLEKKFAELANQFRREDNSTLKRITIQLLELALANSTNPTFPDCSIKHYLQTFEHRERLQTFIEELKAIQQFQLLFANNEEPIEVCVMRRIRLLEQQLNSRYDHTLFKPSDLTEPSNPGPTAPALEPIKASIR